MSGMSVNHSVKCGTKDNSMYEFDRAVRDLKLNRSDKTCAAVNRHLKFLSNATDTSTFDPNTAVTSEFFSNLIELFTILDPPSPVLWNCVNVLKTACKNQATHSALISTYQFVPYLSQMLGDHLQPAEKISLLGVLQDLTCGINKNCFVPNLHHMITTLCRWIQAKESDQIVLLSLGVIVNVCLNNQPAQYIFANAMDVRTLSRYLLTLTDHKIVTCVAKMFIILDQMHGVVPQKTLGQLLDCTLRSINDAIIVKDHLDLRQHIEFYLNLKSDSDDVRRIIATFADFPELIKDLLCTMNRCKESSNDEGMSECTSLVFRFFCSILECNLPCIDDLYKVMAKLALDWIRHESVAPDALCLLKTVLLTSTDSSKLITEMIMPEIYNFTPDFHLVNARMSIVMCTMYYHVFDLLKIFLRGNSSRTQVLEHLKKEHFEKMFETIVNNTNESGDVSKFSPQALDMYINAMSVISVVGLSCNDWGQFLHVLFEQKPVQTVLALGLTTGDQQRRINALEVISRNNVQLSKSVGDILNEISQPTPVVQSNHIKFSPILNSNTSANTVKFDEIMRVLTEMKAGKQLSVDVCDVMDLYEYRLSISAQSQQTLTAYAEAAATYSNQLQQQITQLNEVQQRTQQMHLRSEHMRKDAKKKIDALEAQIRELRIERKLRAQLQAEQQEMEAEMQKRNKQITELIAKQEEVVAERDNALFKVIPHLKESLMKREKVSQRQEDNIKALQSEVNAAKRNLQEKELELKSTEEELRAAHDDLNRAKDLSEERGTLLDAIMKLTNAKK